MGFIYFVFLLVGTIVFLYSIIESTIYCSLYGDRNIMCPEKFVKKEKATDIVAIVHNIYLAIFGLSCLVFGLNAVTEVDFHVAFNIIMVSCFLSLVDMGLMWYFGKKYDLHNTLVEIKKQWKTQKKITDIHNHEVNMYRAIKYFEKYKKQVYLSVFVNFIVVIFVTFVI